MAHASDRRFESALKFTSIRDIRVLTVIVLGLVGYVVGVIIYNLIPDTRSSFEIYLGEERGACLIFILCILLGVSGGVIAAASLGSSYIATRSIRIPIVSLKDNMTTESIISRRYVVTTSQMEYFFYSKKGSGYKILSRPASTIIYTDEQDNPYVEDYYDYHTLSKGDWRRWFVFLPVLKTYVSSLHVPEGTIITNLSLDSE